MDEELFDVGLEARRRVLGEEYVTRAFATADSFNIEFQQLVTEYCWGGVWGRSALTDRQRSLNNLCLLAALNRSRGVQDALPRRVAQRVHARRAARHADPDHGLRRRAGGRRGVPPRSRGARSRRHHTGAGAVTSTPGPSVLGFVGLGNMGGPMATRIAAAGLEVVCFDAAGTRDRLPRGRDRGERALPTSPRAADTIFVSVPDGTASARRRATRSRPHAERRATTVIDLSTVGPAAAQEAAALLAGVGVTYCRRAGVGRRGRRAGRHDLVDVRRARRGARGPSVDPRRVRRQRLPRRRAGRARARR